MLEKVTLLTTHCHLRTPNAMPLPSKILCGFAPELEKTYCRFTHVRCVAPVPRYVACSETDCQSIIIIIIIINLTSQMVIVQILVSVRLPCSLVSDGNSPDCDDGDGFDSAASAAY